MKAEPLRKELLRNSIFAVVEEIIQFELSDNAKNLIAHYYNSATTTLAAHKAIHAVERYISDNIPENDERSEKLNFLLNDMIKKANDFDAE